MAKKKASRKKASKKKATRKKAAKRGKAKKAGEAPLWLLLPTFLVIGLSLVFVCWTVFSTELAELAADALIHSRPGVAP